MTDDGQRHHGDIMPCTIAPSRAAGVSDPLPTPPSLYLSIPDIDADDIGPGSGGKVHLRRVPAGVLVNEHNGVALWHPLRIDVSSTAATIESA